MWIGLLTSLNDATLSWQKRKKRGGGLSWKTAYLLIPALFRLYIQEIISNLDERMIPEIRLIGVTLLGNLLGNILTFSFGGGGVLIISSFPNVSFHALCSFYLFFYLCFPLLLVLSDSRV
jgi:hypothetical protein